MIQPAARRFVAVVAVATLSAGPGPAAGPAPALGQAPTAVDAELPGPGVLWLEVVPDLRAWSDQFASGSDSLADGSREPLHADYGGPVAQRLYPGPGLLADAVNRGADSLGFAPMSPGEVALGSLEFGSISSRRTTLPVRALLGVTERIALDVGVSFVQTRTDASFRYDSTGATLAPAGLALEDGSAYLDGLGSARSELRELLEGGGLPPDQEEAARRLLERSGAFAAVLGRRLEDGGLLPLAGSRPGAEMAGLAADLRSSFGEFGFQVPELPLASAAASETLDRFLTGPFVDAEPLRGEAVGLQPAELEVGLRVGLLDTFRPRAEREAGAPAAADGLALRTTAGLRLRWPLAEPDRAPFHTPSRFLDTPAGSGARVVEAALYQDAAYGILQASAAAGFGLALADEPTLRVHDPGRPLALAPTRTALRREPGDYLWITISPRAEVNPHLSMGAEYAYWQEGESGFSRIGSPGEGDGGSGSIDPTALERETGARRHSAGISVRYRAGTRGSEGPGPVEAAFTYRIAVAGSGGQTPASNVMGVRIRVPVSVGLF